MNPPASPVIPCPACHKGLPISLDRYPAAGGTFPCPACRAPLTLPPKEVFLTAFEAARATGRTAAADSSPGAGPAPAAERWAILHPHGGGIDEVDRAGIRDLIRQGIIDATTDVAPGGTRDWRPAGQEPALARWLEMAAERRRIVYIRPGAEAESMGRRAVRGLAYPFLKGGIAAVIGLAIVSAIPFFSILAGPIASFWSLAAIRESAKGDTTMPAWVETADILHVIWVWLKTVAVSLIALWPMVGWTAFWFWSGGARSGPEALTTFLIGLGVTGLVSLTYYPACLATVAVWDSVLDALNPAYVFRVIRTVGADYGLMLLCSLAALVVGGLSSALLDSLLAPVPFVGIVPGRIATLWASFYAAHLLGWAVHRHEDALGWK